MRDVSLETLPDVNTLDPDHDKSTDCVWNWVNKKLGKYVSAFFSVSEETSFLGKERKGCFIY